VGAETLKVYLLDTDVIWAFRGREPGHADEQLFEWVASQMPSTLFASAITMMEFDNGTRLLERKDKLAAGAIRKWIETRLRPAFEGRIIAIDDAVVRRWSLLGYSDFRDGILAATALQHGLILATRDLGNFRMGKVRTVNPWSYTPEAEDLDWRRAPDRAPNWLKNKFVRA
jgi:predicted nucleic acid-binding protein